MRRFGFGRLRSGAGRAGRPRSSPPMASTALTIAATPGRGYGLYTQLWGMFLLPPALAQGYTPCGPGAAGSGPSCCWRRRCCPTWSWATWRSSRWPCWPSCRSWGRWVPEGVGRGPWAEVWRRALRLGLLLLLVVATAAYFLVPFFLDRAYMNRSVWEEPGKYDGLRRRLGAGGAGPGRAL